MNAPCGSSARLRAHMRVYCWPGGQCKAERCSGLLSRRCYTPPPLRQGRALNS
ncbi:TPA_asm: hypothetical protein G1Q02_21800 [Salmonella enterica subsp. enterica serovar Typhimurium]|nr:hypothetical protein [Salmonella enterica subsp. enterica serovar Typhimurium]